MAITDNATAGAVNTVANWLLQHVANGQPVPGDDDAREALAQLADAAARHYQGAGIDGDRVRELWAERHPRAVTP